MPDNEIGCFADFHRAGLPNPEEYIIYENIRRSEKDQQNFEEMLHLYPELEKRSGFGLRQE